MIVLVAEDDLTSRVMLEAILKKSGYESVTAKDGIEAWEILQQESAPRLIILDWNMPGLDGMEICQRIRKKGGMDPPYIIILTGRDEVCDTIHGLQAGANDYITKPYNKEELVARLKVGQRMLELQSNLNQARSDLTYKATHDSLTGTLNRPAILEVLHKEFSRTTRLGNFLTIGMVDIDKFKEINDQYGHQVGDEVLMGLVQYLQSSLRNYDYLGRYGGDEFMIVLTHRSLSDIENAYNRLRSTICNHRIHTHVGEIQITISIGVAMKMAGMSLDQLLAAADHALYQAKAYGRNQVAVSGAG